LEKYCKKLSLLFIAYVISNTGKKNQSLQENIALLQKKHLKVNIIKNKETALFKK